MNFNFLLASNTKSGAARRLDLVRGRLVTTWLFLWTRRWLDLRSSPVSHIGPRKKYGTTGCSLIELTLSLLRRSYPKIACWFLARLETPSLPHGVQNTESAS